MTTKQKLPSTSRGRQRLLKLADLLETDAVKEDGIKFDLNVICKLSNGDRIRELPALDCGTTACAIGLWGISGQFKRNGVGYHIDGNEVWPTYLGASGRSAAELFFNLSMDESYWLFIASQYPGPTTGAAGERAVAKRIRNFVAGKAAP